MRILAVGSSTHKRSTQLDGLQGLKHYIIRLQTEGCCHVSLNGVTFLQRPGDLLMCIPGDTYMLTCNEENGASLPSTDYFFIIPPGDEWFEEWLHNVRQVTINIGIDQRLIELWRQVQFERRRKYDPNPMLLVYLTRSFLLHLERIVNGKMTDDSMDRYNLSTANNIKEFIEQHATQKLTLQQICSSVGLSTSRGSELFKKAFNQSIIDYAIEVRLSMAKERIVLGGMYLEEIAYICGFSTYPYFNRAFKTRFGISPSEYMQRFRSDVTLR